VTEPDNANAQPNDVAAPAGRDLVLELNFVPTWARRPPGSLLGRFAGSEGGAEERSGTRDRGDRRESDRDRGSRGGMERRGGGPGAGRGERRGDGRGPARGGNREQRPPGGPPSDRRAPPDRGPDRGFDRGPRRLDGQRFRREAPIRLPVETRFMPDQKALSSMVRQIAQLKRAYPLLDLAAIFTSKPETCVARLDVRPDVKDVVLHQCKICGMAALERERIFAHLARAHHGDYFIREETETEAPAGNFTCVARCGLSGVLLGPPNHHSYADKVQELHMTRFPNMPLEAYRQRIEVVRDPALIEQWKTESRKRVTYRFKDKPDGEPMTWTSAEARFTREIAPGLVQQGRRVAVPVSLVRQMEEQALLRTIEEAWRYECRFPGNLLFALRGAFRGKHLRVFRAHKVEFVTAIEPAPIDPARAVEPIRSTLEFLRAHPGCKREQLVEALRPGKALDSPEAGEVLAPLAWLVEKGHIIEFFDGALSVPLGPAQPAPSAPANAEPAPETGTPPEAPAPAP